MFKDWQWTSCFLILNIIWMPSGWSKTLRVDNSRDLVAALANPQWDRIELDSSLYLGPFQIERSGTAGRPVELLGSKGTQITCNSITSGYGLHITGSNVKIQNISISKCSKGVVLDGATHVALLNLNVTDVGEEGVHFRSHSRMNLISDSVIRRTGLKHPGFGEGIYIGSAKNNWCKYTNCKPDTSDENQIVGNTIENVTAEPIDIKEGVTGTRVYRNTLDGSGLSGENYADSAMDVKGNASKIIENTVVLRAPNQKMIDGFQTHVVMPVWGQATHFEGNRIQASIPGFGINVQNESQQTFVSCSNEAFGAGQGLSNRTCQ